METIQANKNINSHWTPAVNVLDNETNYEIELVAPGLHKNEFWFEIDNGLLIIKGEKEPSIDAGNKNYKRREFDFQSFTKSFILPAYVSKSDVGLQYESGIIKLSINKN